MTTEIGVPHVEPVVREAAVGWLATSPADYPYRIGVVGDNPDEARQRFAVAVAAWSELHARATAGPGPPPYKVRYWNLTL